MDVSIGRLLRGPGTNFRYGTISKGVGTVPVLITGWWGMRVWGCLNGLRWGE